MERTELMANPVHHDRGTAEGDGEKAWRSYLDAIIRFGGSDLICKSETAPKVRLRGSLKKLETPPTSTDLMFQIAKDILDDRQYGYFQKHGSMDFAYDYENARHIVLFGRNLTESLRVKEVKSFLKRKWEKELNYRLKKELWAFHENRIAVRFEYEWHDSDNNWYRSYGNENWEFDENGLMKKRFASINDIPISEADRKIK